MEPVEEGLHDAAARDDQRGSISKNMFTNYSMRCRVNPAYYLHAALQARIYTCANLYATGYPVISAVPADENGKHIPHNDRQQTSKEMAISLMHSVSIFLRYVRHTASRTYL
eukprot:GHVU01097303.1.p1 GENE.GHVU01097303.1~~GHVU01097303.1.p1  ORF type:complete len:112 (+),score=5.68 GHVU01097303.1:284-619(+)